jgi:hypothetical protein
MKPGESHAEDSIWLVGGCQTMVAEMHSHCQISEVQTLMLEEESQIWSAKDVGGVRNFRAFRFSRIRTSTFLPVVNQHCIRHIWRHIHILSGCTYLTTA